MHLAIVSRYFLRKSPTNTLVEGSTLVIHDCRRVHLDAVQWRDMFVSTMFIATLIWLVSMMLVREIKIMVINSIVENPCGRLMRN